MKRIWKNQLLIVLCMLTLSFSSCRKCITCTVSDSSGNVLVDKEETCGSREDRDLAEDKAKDQATLISGTYSCEE
jgi:hypothetical protein